MSAYEPLPAARFANCTIDGTEWLVARAGRNWLVIPFVSIWLAGWTLGGGAAITQLFTAADDGGRLFLGIWLIGWALGWFFAASLLAWQLGGRMQVAVQNGALAYAWSMPFYSREKRYDPNHIRNLREGGAGWPWGFGTFHISYPPFMPGMPGSVQFDYGGRTVKIMPGLDEAEGSAIVQWLESRLDRARPAEHE